MPTPVVDKLIDQAAQNDEAKRKAL